jgi:hypothetical protein
MQKQAIDAAGISRAINNLKVKIHEQTNALAKGH